MIEVYKFGGVAVGTADAVRAAEKHVRDCKSHLVVIVSAMNGITDLLLDCARAALAGDRETCRGAAETFESRHMQLVEELIDDQRVADELFAIVDGATAEMMSIADSIAVLRELTTRAQDAMVSRGERVLARIFAACVNATYVDASEVVFAERRAGTLWPNFAKCERAAKKTILPLLDRTVVVVPGYLGSGPDGEVVTLGRGGSDFSAAILARSLNADAVTLWKEVDGLMTADPRIVPSARVLPELHYREAAELAFYGAKVLHPRTMIPLADKKIPLLVRNTFREMGGTRISADAQPGEYPVKALTAVPGQALISIEGSGMIGVPGVAARTFGALAAAGHSVSMISQASSESSICFVVPEVEAAHAVAALEEAFALERKMKFIDRIRAEKGVALIAVVGLGMRGRPGIAARTFSALAAEHVNVHAIAQGSSELNITATIAEDDVPRALRALHAEYHLDKIRPLADTTSRESKVTFLGFGQIGRGLARQLAAQEKRLRADFGVDIKVIAVADRS
ncbi:MAG TPA: aspartate kinase, partial [Thermoanaerobaculia bacterium]|nr:aspartate kinase [Thermoanaerobaculia bacterium]